MHSCETSSCYQRNGNNALGNGESVGLLSTDMSKAFDWNLEKPQVPRNAFKEDALKDPPLNWSFTMDFISE